MVKTDCITIRNLRKNINKRKKSLEYSTDTPFYLVSENKIKDEEQNLSEETFTLLLKGSCYKLTVSWGLVYPLHYNRNHFTVAKKLWVFLPHTALGSLSNPSSLQKSHNKAISVTDMCLDSSCFKTMLIISLHS